MRKSILRAAFLFLVPLLGVACGDPPKVISGSDQGEKSPAGGQTTPPIAASSGDLSFQTPEGWVKQTPTSSMRVGQYQLPRAEGDSEDASLVVFYFGQGQGGPIDANLERWVGQMEQPDGRPSSERAKKETMTVNGLRVTLLDVTGTYTAEMSPGSGDRQNRTNSRLRAAVIETPKGAYFVKLVGPEKTVARWEQEFSSFLKSAEFKSI